MAAQPLGDEARTGGCARRSTPTSPGRRAARAPGASFFQRAWFHEIDGSELPATTHSVRFWDLAATEPSAASPDPDYTVGVRLDLDERTGSFYLSDLVRVRMPPGAVEQLVAATAKRDGKVSESSSSKSPARPAAP